MLKTFCNEAQWLKTEHRVTESPKQRNLIGTILRAIGMRIVFWGGLGGLVLFYLCGGLDVFRSPGDFGPVAPQGRTFVGTSGDGGEDGSEAAARSNQWGPGWPHLRGPNFNATSDETDLADRWPSEGPPAVWVREIGEGYSALTVVGDRVYTQRQTIYGQSVLCLDAGTGETVWEYQYGWPYQRASMYPGPRATPTVHDGRVYYAGPRGRVGCLNAQTGEPIWELTLEKEFSLRGFDFGYAPSPTVIDGKVILPVGDEAAAVVALSVKDGSVVWTSGTEPASYCSAIPITFKGRRLILAYLKNGVSIIDAGSGEMLASYGVSDDYDEHAAMPIYDEPLLMFSGPFGAGARVLRIRSGGSVQEAPNREQAASAGPPPELSLEHVMYIDDLSNDVASSVLVDGSVYGFDLRDLQSKVRRPSRGTFKCFDLASGQLRWESDEPGHASLIAADGKLLMLNDRGEVLLLRATPSGYEQLGRAEIFHGEICWTTPTLADGRLFLRSPTRAACLLVAEPRKLDASALATARPASEIPRKRRISVKWLLAGERDAPADPPDLAELSRWYAVSVVAVLGVAGVLGLVTWVGVLGAGRSRPGLAAAAGRAVFWSAALVLGVVVTPLANRYLAEFIFTWPASVFVAHHFAIVSLIVAGRHRGSLKWRAVSLACLAGFFVGCLTYYHLCQALDIGMLSIYLMGLLPSWLVALPVGWLVARPGQVAKDIALAMLSFTAYFWITAGLIWWWSC